MKLDLGSGNIPRNGFSSVDYFAPHADYKINLCKFPWPWEDSSVDELHSSHFLEHIPDVYIKSNGSYVQVPDETSDRDLLCKFMDEAYRVLIPGGTFRIIVPSGMSSWGFRDPTHRRFFMSDSFFYFNNEWRISRGVDHYLCDCNFDINISNVVPEHLLQLPPHIIESKCNYEWNISLELNVLLTSLKRY